MNQISHHYPNGSQKLHPLLGQQLHSDPQIQFECQIGIDSPAFLKHHCVYDTAIVPATAYLEMAIAAGAAVFKVDNLVVEDVVIQRALILPENGVQTIQLIFTPEGTNAASFQIFSLTTGVASPSKEKRSGMLHASGKVLVLEPQPEISQRDLATLQTQELSVEAYYQDSQERGIDYGASFQVIEQLWRQEGEALGQIQLPEALLPEAGDYKVHPVLLDTCFQVLWAALPDSAKGKTYLPVGLERLKVHRSLDNRLWSQAKLRPITSSTQQILTADLSLLDESGALVIEIEGILIEEVSPEILLRSLQKKQQLAVTATFTAEPVEKSLAFWMQELDMPSQIEFAPYGQVFQELLNPTSLLASNQDGVNVVLVRLDDWEQPDKHLQLRVEPSEKETIIADQPSHILPNRLEVAHLNKYESEYLYQEIFLDLAYLRNGIVLKEDDYVVDIGANIGLFSLFIQQKCPNATIYAFEPSPHAFQRLETNTKLYCKNANVFQCGLAGENTEEIFTFYPNSSVFSGFFADTEEDEKAIRAVILNMLQQYNSSLKEEELENWADELIAGRLERETYKAQLRTLSSVIEECNIERIDLLKLDAEKSELPVLQGIKDHHWPIIKQMVVEVHDQEGSIISEVKRLLQEKGFELIINEENLLHGSGLYNIYATRPASYAKSSPENALSNTAKLEQNVKDLANALSTSAQRSATPHLVCICPPAPTAVADAERRSFYQQMEDFLITQLQNGNGTYLVKTAELTANYPVTDYYDSHGDEFGHVPYTPAFFTALGTAIARKIHTIKSAPYKVIALDCDNTLWKGVCGEDGPEGIEIDAPRQALQEFMVAQRQAGMLLSLCSKNQEEDVWKVFEHCSEMPLKRDQIVQSRINWQPKSENLQSLAEELNLGLDSFIFVDDNPIECAEVQTNCPGVLTLQLPSAAEQIPQFLNHIWAFDHLKLTKEDEKRAELYQQNLLRERSRKESLTFDDFLAGLELKVEIAPMAAPQLARVSQLTQRTNQFNLTTIRRSESEIKQLCDGNFECLVTQVSDRFGDYGLVGVLLFQAVDDALKVDSFMLSCRALGRGVEHQMLAKLGAIAKERGLSQIEVSYAPTQKNQPALNFLETVGADVKQPVGEGWLYQFPIDLAAELTYEPSVVETVASSPAKAKGKPSQVNRKQQSLVMNRIATELYEPGAILQVIESQQPAELLSTNAPTVLPRNETEQQLADLIAKVIDKAATQLDVELPFNKIGLESLDAIQLRSRVKTEFSVDVPMVKFMEGLSIAGLAELVDQQSGDQQPEVVSDEIEGEL
ncbi:MAG: FkbM family methyltransferase [Symploca sp. SIO2E6]|nr:FkbM family methyltransferase [Symploca sp. SIO2E6]